MKTCISILTAVIVSASTSILSSEAATWQHPLYLPGDGYWRQRIPLSVTNQSELRLEGRPVVVKIGGGPGELHIGGTRAEAIRLVDSRGVEMLYGLEGSDGQPISAGPVPEGSSFVLPAECEARATADYFLYFDNPAACEVPDFLELKAGLVDGDVESGDPPGENAAPAGWRHDKPDPQHRASWSTERPQSGKWCLKTVVAEGAEPTWIATRQEGIPIIGGAKYVVRAWVRGENVKGHAGWYLHVGNRENSMMAAPMLSAGDGTFDWKQVTAEFTAPVAADRLSLGTVLRGTGTAWFDNVSLTCLEPGKIRVQVGRPERLTLAETKEAAAWYPGGTDATAVRWGHRAAVKVFHFSTEPAEHVLLQVDASMLARRMRGRLNWDSLLVTAGGKAVKHWLSGERILFVADLPPRSMRTFYVYFSDDPHVRAAGESSYAGLLREDGQWNLVTNAGFESGEPMPEAWTHSPADGKDGVQFATDNPGRDGLGRRCAKMHVPHSAPKSWRGWHQTVPVKPGKSYLYAAWVRCEDVRGGPALLHAHCLTAKGSLCEKNAYRSAGAPIDGTTDWTFLSGVLEMPQDAAKLELHLTMEATGTVWHDGVLVAEVVPGTVVRLEGRPVSASQPPVVWPVPAVEKVFQDTPVPREIAPAAISLAGNEREPLQLAVRSGEALSQVEIVVQPPIGPGGAKLQDVDVGVVGYVPMDHTSSYYRSDTPTWQRKFPARPGSCDGWPGMWPDPLLPRATLDLEPNVTQAVWITVNAARGAPAGDYRGSVRLRAAGQTLAEVPFGVHVWGFSLPEESHVAAIYDVRFGPGGRQWKASLDEMYPKITELMARNRLCPDAVRPDPEFRYEDGRVVADFSEFDRAATRYFDQLKLPVSYTPHIFYLFGWGHPPKTLFGERPYPGDPPYENADRSRLRPEYKRVYQACLNVFGDHVKEKGWDKKFILYISDEPHFKRPGIIEQMKALCQMIHEVDPAIPIYSSTWSHLPEWDRSLDVWGIGHYGRVPAAEMAQMRAAGSRIWFTTDGQMCTDTPYCAVERLLPHYCFQYGAETYEFWGVAWQTYDPYRFGWHAYIRQSAEPGEYHWVRYPNGDGFLLYPGATSRAARAGDCPDFRAAKTGLSPSPSQEAGPVTSIRFEQGREGVEDFEYLYLLRSLIAKAKGSGRDARRAEEALKLASALVEIPNAGGRYSSKILPDPMAVYNVRHTLAEAIERLK